MSTPNISLILLVNVSINYLKYNKYENGNTLFFKSYMDPIDLVQGSLNFCLRAKTAPPQKILSSPWRVVRMLDSCDPQQPADRR